MRLIVTTPTALVEDVEGVREVRAEDETGAFAIRPGHADFVTVLPVSIVTWRDAAREGFVAVRRGVLSVRAGKLVEIAARGAYREDQLASLGDAALEELQQADDAEDVSRKSEARLHLATIRQIERMLRGGSDTSSLAPQLTPRQTPSRPGAPK